MRKTEVFQNLNEHDIVEPGRQIRFHIEILDRCRDSARTGFRYSRLRKVDPLDFDTAVSLEEFSHNPVAAARIEYTGARVDPRRDELSPLDLTRVRVGVVVFVRIDKVLVKAVRWRAGRPEQLAEAQGSRLALFLRDSLRSPGTRSGAPEKPAFPLIAAIAAHARWILKRDGREAWPALSPCRPGEAQLFCSDGDVVHDQVLAREDAVQRQTKDVIEEVDEPAPEGERVCVEIQELEESAILAATVANLDLSEGAHDPFQTGVGPTPEVGFAMLEPYSVR